MFFVYADTRVLKNCFEQRYSNVPQTQTQKYRQCVSDKSARIWNK